MQGTVCFGNIEPISDLAQMTRTSMRRAIEVQGAEFCLGVSEDVLDRRELRQIPRIFRAEADAFATVNHGSSQPECDCCDSIRICHRLNRVEIMRSDHAGKVRIKTWAMQRADDLLQNHGHLFFFQTIRGGAHVRLSMLAESRSVNSLYRLGEFLESNLQLRLLIPQHERFVNTRERLVLRVFQ